MKRFLFEYVCDGQTFGVEIIATDIAEAKHRIFAMRTAEYKGEIYATVKIGLVDKVLKTISNLAHEDKP